MRAGTQHVGGALINVTFKRSINETMTTTVIATNIMIMVQKVKWFQTTIEHCDKDMDHIESLDKLPVREMNAMVNRSMTCLHKVTMSAKTYAHERSPGNMTKEPTLVEDITSNVYQGAH